MLLDSSSLNNILIQHSILSCAFSQMQGRSQAVVEIVVENGVISEISIFSNKFSKKIKKLNFSHRIFIKIFQSFLKISQQFGFFVQTQKMNA